MTSRLPLLLERIHLHPPNITTIPSIFRRHIHSTVSGMANRNETPYRAQKPKEVNELVHNLNTHTGKKSGKGGSTFSVRKNTYAIPNGRSVDSWRLQDWDYKKSFLPTYARGLFTYQNDSGDWEIAVRGYDKFFNHGEVRKTEWPNVEANTRGPYELSVKENGCIIFISGLDDDSLLVCSKHSTGAGGDVKKSHAVAGEAWVDIQLAKVGKTREEFARKLREMNATAVAELCDDNFEEHVLQYTPEDSGLYLHGINLNLPEFATYPHHILDRFAEDWGFQKTQYVVMNDIHDVKNFLDKVAETGSYAGRDTEGFVIRCQAWETKDSEWQDWFFKYKFEEPYLMYRQWRECTKALIAGKPPKYKKHKKVTDEYLEFARARFLKEPGLMKEYQNNHGIIGLRNDFLQERGLKGSDIIRQEQETGEEISASATSKNVILVPIATIGCGKTTVALGLVKLFGWGHVQNDNIQGKGQRARRFAEAIFQSLLEHGVMIADRNNCSKREREQFLHDTSQVVPDAKYVALHYVHDRGNYEEIRKALRDRVLSRGDNHQTIQAASKGPDEVIKIMESFLHRFEPCDPESAPDDQFDSVIDLDVTATSRENLETVVTHLYNTYPKLFSGNMPSSHDLDDAIEFALNAYKPDLKQDLSRNTNGKQNGKQNKFQQNQQQSQPKGGATKAQKPPRLEFFAVRLPAPRITSILESSFRDQPAKVAKFFRQLQGTRRVQSEFHVTLIHRLAQSDRPEIWQKLTDVHGPKLQAALTTRNAATRINELEPELGQCKVKFERILWDHKVMCIVVRLQNEEGQLEVETANPVAHVTVGTADQKIKPVESNNLIQKWLQEGTEGEIQELPLKGNVVIDGSVKGVLSKF